MLALKNTSEGVRKYTSQKLRDITYYTYIFSYFARNHVPVRTVHSNTENIPIN